MRRRAGGHGRAAPQLRDRARVSLRDASKVKPGLTVSLSPAGPFLKVLHVMRHGFQVEIITANGLPLKLSDIDNIWVRFT